MLAAAEIRRVSIESGELSVSIRGAEGPVVVLENGLSICKLAWEWVVRSLEKNFRVISYDRLGTGLSSKPAGEVNAKTSAIDLQLLLEALDISGPIILVGFSYGGIVTRHFVSSHPNKVQAWLLVDPSGTDYAKEVADAVALNAKTLSVSYKALSFLPAFVRPKLNSWVVDGLPDKVKYDASQIVHSRHHLVGSAMEWQAFHANCRIADALQLPDIPTSILSAGTPLNKHWNVVKPEMQASHARLAQRIPRATCRTVVPADHMSFLLSRDHAEYVAKEVKRLSDRY